MLAGDDREAKPGDKLRKGDVPSRNNGEEKFSPPLDAPSTNGKAASKAAAAVGLSEPTYRKAKEVVEAAEDDPEAYGDLQEKMDATGKVEPVHRELREIMPCAPRTNTQAARPQRETQRNQRPYRKLLWTARYRRFRTMLIRERPLCERCQARGELRPAVECHHVRGLANHPEDLCDEERCEMLCTPCHSEATAKGEGVKEDVTK